MLELSDVENKEIKMSNQRVLGQNNQRISLTDFVDDKFLGQRLKRNRHSYLRDSSAREEEEEEEKKTSCQLSIRRKCMR